MANEKEPKNKKRFFKDFKAELKKVIWPTPKQLVNNTAAVVVIVIITAAIVFALDFGFDMLNQYGINPIKSKVKGNNAGIEQNIDTNLQQNLDHDHDHETDPAEDNTLENNSGEELNNIENNNVNE